MAKGGAEERNSREEYKVHVDRVRRGNEQTKRYLFDTTQRTQTVEANKCETTKATADKR
jgi:hypothetical protein